MLSLHVIQVLRHVNRNISIILESPQNRLRKIEGSPSRLADLIHEHNDIPFDDFDELQGKVLNLPEEAIHEESLEHLCGGSVDKCKASIRFLGEDLDPNQVSAMLKGKPSKSWRKGDLKPSKAFVAKQKVGGWILESPEPSKLSLEQKIVQLFEGLTDDLSIWTVLTTRCSADIFCYLEMRCWNRGLSLSPKLMKMISNRNLTLGLDIYYTKDDERAENDME